MTHDASVSMLLVAVVLMTTCLPASMAVILSLCRLARDGGERVTTTKVVAYVSVGIINSPTNEVAIMIEDKAKPFVTNCQLGRQVQPKCIAIL